MVILVKVFNPLSVVIEQFKEHFVHHYFVRSTKPITICYLVLVFKQSVTKFGVMAERLIIIVILQVVQVFVAIFSKTLIQL